MRFAAGEAKHGPAETFRDFQMLMHSDTEMITTKSEKQISLIRSVDDWKHFLDRMDKDSDHPLAGMNKQVLREFTESLLFGRYGIANAYVAGMEKELSYDNYGRLWEYFGMTLRLAADHKGYKCKSAGTMSAIISYICTSNCYAPGNDGLVAFRMSEFGY